MAHVSRLAVQPCHKNGTNWVTIIALGSMTYLMFGVFVTQILSSMLARYWHRSIFAHLKSRVASIWVRLVDARGECPKSNGFWVAVQPLASKS